MCRILAERIHSAGQEVPRLLRNPKVHYRVHNIPPLDPIPIHMNPINRLSSHFLKIHFIIILSSASTSLKWNEMCVA